MHHSSRTSGLFLLVALSVTAQGAAEPNPSRLPLPGISFSDDEQTITVKYNGTTRTIRRPVVPLWNYTVVGTSWWVSPTGDDSAAGTEAAPLKTLAEAVNRTVPGHGDAVYLMAGDYVASTSGHSLERGKQHFIHKGGTAEHPLVVSCAPVSIFVGFSGVFQSKQAEPAPDFCVSLKLCKT